MTEQDWLASTDPEAMLGWIMPDGELSGRSWRGVTERKLRLFAESAGPCQICRDIGDDPDWSADRYAVYVAGAPCLGAAPKAALLRCIFGNPFADPAHLIHRCPRCGQERSWHCPKNSKWPHCPDCSTENRPVEMTHRYLHWIKWNDGTVPRIAQGIYDERRWGDMPILADALLDAGADDEDILQHCRGYESVPDGIYPPDWMILRGPHVRGCWVLDLLLGKEKS